MQKNFLVILIALFTSSCALFNPNPNRDDKDPIAELRPFTTDYCSEWPNGVKTNPTQWAGCCFTHDLHYWIGGTQDERITADKELKKCVKISGSSLSSFLMYIGVRFGGRPGDASYSWGYGWSKSREYAKMSRYDLEKAEALLEASEYNKQKEKDLIQNFKAVLKKRITND